MSRYVETSSPLPKVFSALVELRKDGVLSFEQEQRISDAILVSDPDAFFQPWLADVREHTKAYIESFAGFASRS